VARILEHKAKEVLRGYGISVPQGAVAPSGEAAMRVAAEIGFPVIVKAQVFVTGRAAKGLIRTARTPAEAADAAQQVLGRTVGGFPVELVLVEAKL